MVHQASLPLVLVGLRCPVVPADKLIVQDTQLLYEFSKKMFCISVNLKRFPNTYLFILSKL